MEQYIKSAMLLTSGALLVLAIKNDIETKKLRAQVEKINERTYRQYPYVMR